MTTIEFLIGQLLTNTLAELLANNKKDAPFIFQKIGWILLVARLLPNLGDVTEVSRKNANKGFAKITDYVRDFLNTKIKDGNVDGKSDGTFRTTKKPFITSSKYREGNDISIANDMDALNTLRLTREEFKDAGYVMFVRDRHAWIKAHKRANTKDLYPIDYANVYDVEMFENAIVELRKIIQKYGGSINAFAIKYLPYLKSQMKLKFHQHLAQNMYTSGSIFLFGMKCRAGKTVTAAYNIISQQYKTVLFITPVPSETKNPVIDTFRRYIEFDDYDVINLEAGVVIPTPIVKSIILVTSKQYLDKHHNDIAIRNIHFDAVYQDEIHWAGLTEKNTQVRRNIIRDDTSLILLSGTGNRVRIMLAIDDVHTFSWNLEEEMACKRGDIVYLENVYGKENVDIALRRTFGDMEEYASVLKNMYAEMPQLRQMVYNFKPEFRDNFAEFIEKDQYSFNMQELFRMKDGELVYRERVINFLKSFLGSDDGTVHNSIMDQIRALGTRTGHYGPKYYAGGGGATQLWFLPEQVSGGSLNSLSAVIKSILDELFPEYMAVVVNSNAKLDTREGMEKFVAEQEKIAIGKKKQGLILLLGKMMAMGVSLPRADIVCMFNNLTKIELYTQMSMRCLTQDVGKSTGFVIDFNQKRVLSTSMALVSHCVGTGSEIIERMTKIIAFGSNSFEVKDVTDVIAHFVQIWENPKFDANSVLKLRLGQYANAFAVTTDEKKDIMKAAWSRSIQPNLHARLELLDASEKIDAKTVASSAVSDKPKKDEEILDDVIPDFQTEIVTNIPPLVAWLTHDHRREEFTADLLKMIRDDPEKNEYFREICGNWWKGTKSLNFIDLLINIFERSDLNANRAISSIISAFKSRIMAARLIRNMHATLELHNSTLEPKESEKKEFGEVFTPSWFVDDNMLAAYPPETWSNPDEKFYDPAAGAGVFCICIYYRLMDGLQSIFPNESERENHILKKMLFMSELGAKNVWTLKFLFGETANVYRGDSLTFDAEKHWGFDMKDVHVIGNPPYNKERTRSGASPLYNDFIEKYIDRCKTLSFVVPSRWFAGGKGLDKFRKMMLARRDIRFINHIDDASSVFGSSVSIKGGINYFMVDREYDGDCNYNDTMTDLSTLDILVDSRFVGLIRKFVDEPKLTSLYMGRRYGIETNDSRLTNDTTQLQCFVSQAKGGMKYIDKVHVKKDCNSWKVITPRAAHGHGSGFGGTFIGTPNHVHSSSYISFNVASENEAKSLLNYMKTSLANKLLGLRKPAQDINENTCKWIPLPPLDREWTDESINEYYKLSSDEISLLN